MSANVTHDYRVLPKGRDRFREELGCGRVTPERQLHEGRTDHRVVAIGWHFAETQLAIEGLCCRHAAEGVETPSRDDTFVTHTGLSF